MITYSFTNEDTLTNQLYEAIKNDITNGTLKDNEKLPSKRALAKHLNISTITVENAYMQLLSEGYIYSKPRSGYYVAHILHRPKRQIIPLIHEEKKEKMKIDFSSNATSPDHFPFTSWAKV
ncbi:MAG: GntR family transcriptional regulator, partial [Intestinibaculum porci]|uniref:GntR family transcriptional regulator n=1 Tax=Intestinibaculum porci TaxID=2487118 RepID=UPI00240957BA